MVAFGSLRSSRHYLIKRINVAYASQAQDPPKPEASALPIVKLLHSYSIFPSSVDPQWFTTFSFPPFYPHNPVRLVGIRTLIGPRSHGELLGLSERFIPEAPRSWSSTPTATPSDYQW